MSYCRWSSDDFQCDLYCYGSGDNFITNIASNRVVPKEPLPEDIDWGSEDFVDAYIERWSVVSKLVDDADRVPITLPYAGETFIDKTLEEFKQTYTDVKRYWISCTRPCV